MNKDELEKINRRVLQARWEIPLPDYLWNDAIQLIAAVEELQAELAEAEERDDAMDKVGVADKRTIADLRKQLAEAHTMEGRKRADKRRETYG